MLNFNRGAGDSLLKDCAGAVFERVDHLGPESPALSTSLSHRLKFFGAREAIWETRYPLRFRRERRLRALE
jgi:hypothetical protein